MGVYVDEKNNIDWEIGAHNMTVDALDELLRPYIFSPPYDGSYDGHLISTVGFATDEGWEENEIMLRLMHYTAKHPKIYFEVIYQKEWAECPDKWIVHHGKVGLFHGVVSYKYQGEVKLKEDFRA